jgi:L-rhamnose-H+ transport protein
MQLVLGVVLALVAGTVNGMFALPMKLAQRWKWENIWLPFSALAMVVFPYLIASRAVPRLAETYGQIDPSSLMLAVACGIAAYTGSLLFGISIPLIGNALAFALLVGSMSAVGVLGPIVMFQPDVLASPGGRWILFGVAFLFAALVVCARAGILKARKQADISPVEGGPGQRSVVLRGMLLAIAGGVLSGLLPLGMSMSWAGRIAASAVRYGGASPAAAQNAVLLPILLGGALPNCLYAAYLLYKDQTWRLYRGVRGDWLITPLMAVMYSGSVALWGMSTAANMLGRLGPSVGWALFVGAVVVSSNVGGILTGEWKHAGGKPLAFMVVGVVLMVLAMALIGHGNFLLNL